MGHYSYTCKLTGLPITGSTPAVLIIMRMREKLYNCSEKHLKQYGSTSLVSNDGAQVKFQPVWFPIHCNYNDYGGTEDIRKDDNTSLLEKYYGLPIETIMKIVTSGRKDDGYDDALKAVKKPNEPDEYGKPQYEERYKELLTYSGMWVHGEVYDELTNDATDDHYNKLDLGTPELLKALGFEEIEKDKKAERYNRRFQKGKLIVNSDRTWINVKGEHIFTLPDFKKYCQKMGEDIDIDVIDKKDMVEQIFDYVIPLAKSIGQDKVNLDDVSKAMKEYEKLSKEEKKSKKGLKLFAILIKGTEIGMDKHPMARTIKYLLLNQDEYNFYNPMTLNYFKAVKEGKIRDNMVRFWRFDHYMYCTGRYYDIVGTSPQDGEHGSVMKVLEVATKVLNKVIEERKEWDDE